MAHYISLRSTCLRATVGAVAVKNHRVLCVGYNGSVAGQPHCDEVGCLMVEGHCIRCIHAEANLLVQAAIHGLTLVGATIYTTTFPCHGCAKLLAAVGIGRLVAGAGYDDVISQNMTMEFLRDVEVEFEVEEP